MTNPPSQIRVAATGPGELVLDDPLLLAERWHAEGEAVALATVIQTWGSSPRPPGSSMAITGSGRIAGSVSGGCVESAVVEAALESLSDRAPRLLSYGVSDSSAWSVGLACGGTVRVFVDSLGAADRIRPDMLHQLMLARQARRLAVLATRLPDGTQILLQAGDEGLLADPGSSAGAALETGVLDRVTAAARDAAGSDRSRIAAIDGQDWFLHVHAPPPRLLVVGAVHIAQVLAPLARGVGLAVTVIDPRESFATPERFPGTELAIEWPDEALHRLGVDRHSAVVTLTHDPKLDDPALDSALSSPAFYIGALGSRKTNEARRSRLREAGFDEAAIGRIRGPVGLAIGAVGASEIALSILAEIVAVRRGGALAERETRQPVAASD